MKRNILTIFCLGAILIAPSCAKETLETGKSNDAVKTVPMTLSVCDENSDPDGKTILGDIIDGESAEVLFTSDDKLFVFGEKDGDVQGVQFESADEGCKHSYKFTTDNWPEGYIPKYAISSTSTSTRQTCTADGNVTMLVNNAAQKLDFERSYASNTAAHIGQVDSTSVRLKNVCGLLQFSVKNEDITKIVVTGNGGEALGGWINVDYGKMSEPIDFFTPEADAVKSLEVSAGAKVAVNNCLPANTTFFISILPGYYPKGLTLELYNSKNESAERIVDVALPIKRGEIRKFKKPIDDGLVFKEMPDELVFSIIKGSWPFREKCLAASEQDKDNGDEYTYHYTSEDGYSHAFKFRLFDTDLGYSTSKDEVIKFPGKKSYLQLPAIEGRVLRSVTLTTRNSQGGGKNIAISEAIGGSELGSGKVSFDEVEHTWYALGPVETKPNTSYYVNSLDASAMFTKIEAVYVKELSPKEPLPEEITVTLDFSQDILPFVETKLTGENSQAQASETCDGEVYTFKYSETALLKVGICKGQVNSYKHYVTTDPKYLEFPRIGPAEAYEDNEGFVKTPAIPGRYLKEVKITANVSAHTIYICKSNKKEKSGSGVLASFMTKAYKDGPVSSGELDGEVNTPYYLFRNGSSAERYVKIELVYGTKTPTE